MGVFDIVVIISVSVAVVAVIGRIIYKKVTGKGAGCCNCGDCAKCPHCNKKRI